jgi:hypothetical protein
MRKLLLISTFLIFSKLILTAQHCPFDAEGIIVVKIHSKGDTSIIQNLKITLIDSTGNSVLTPKWDFGKFLGDTVKLWQNPSETTFKTTIDCDHPANPTKIRFPFANDNYVLMCPIYFKIEKYKLRVEDTDGEKNGGSFSTAFYKLTKEDLYSLCGTYKSPVYPEEQFEKKVNYAPISIELTRH